MKSLFLMVVLYWTALSVSGQIPDPPNPPRLVNDYADMLSDSEERMIEAKLVAYNSETSIQIAVVTMPDIGEYDKVTFAQELGKKWGVGQKELDNGVVFLIVTNPKKREMFIATGYGIESYLTDLEAKRICSEKVKPLLKGGNYFDGIKTGVSEIMLDLGEMSWNERKELEKAQALAAERSSQEFWDVAIPVLIVLGIFGLIGLILYWR